MKLSIWYTDFFFFGKILSRGIEGSSGSCTYKFWGISIWLPTGIMPIYIPTNKVLFFSPHHPYHLLFCCCCCFINCHSIQDKMICHCGFDMHFPGASRCWTFFQILLGHLSVLFWKNLFMLLAQFLIWLLFLLLCNCWFLVYYGD